MTVHGFRLFALCYIFCGLNIYASAFFTALCNGACLLYTSLSAEPAQVYCGGMLQLYDLPPGAPGVGGAGKAGS